jgi:hypothetical protein
LAVVVNQQFAGSKTGESTSVSLIDSLHMLGFSTVFILFLVTILSRILCERYDQPKLARKFDNAFFGVSVIIFTFINVGVTIDALGS